MTTVATNFATWKEAKNKQYGHYNGQGWRRSVSSSQAESLNTALEILNLEHSVTASTIQVAYLKNAKLRPKSDNLEPKSTWGIKLKEKVSTRAGLNTYRVDVFKETLGKKNVTMANLLEKFTGMILLGMNDASGLLFEFPGATAMLIRGVEDTFGPGDVSAFKGTIKGKMLIELKATASKIGQAIVAKLLGPFKSIVKFCRTAKTLYSITDQDTAARQAISGCDVVWDAVTKVQVARVTPIWGEFKEGLKTILKMGLKLFARIGLALATGGLSAALEAGAALSVAAVQKACTELAGKLPGVYAQIKSLDVGDVNNFIESSSNIDAANLEIPLSFNDAMAKLEMLLAKKNIVISEARIKDLNNTFRILDEKNVHKVMTNTLIASYFVCNHSDKELTDIDLNAKLDKTFTAKLKTSLGQLKQFARAYIDGSDYELVPSYNWVRPVNSIKADWELINKKIAFKELPPPEPKFEKRLEVPREVPLTPPTRVAVKPEYKGTFITKYNLFNDWSYNKVKGFGGEKSDSESSISQTDFISNTAVRVGLRGRGEQTNAIDKFIGDYHTLTSTENFGTESYLRSLKTRRSTLMKLKLQVSKYYQSNTHFKIIGRGAKFKNVYSVCELELDYLTTEEKRIQNQLTITSSDAWNSAYKAPSYADAEMLLAKLTNPQPITPNPNRNRIELENQRIDAKNEKLLADFHDKQKLYRKKLYAHNALKNKFKKRFHYGLAKSSALAWAQHVNVVGRKTWGPGMKDTYRLPVEHTPSLGGL